MANEFSQAGYDLARAERAKSQKKPLQNRSTITIEPNSQSPKTGIVDRPAGKIILPPLPGLKEA